MATALAPTTGSSTVRWVDCSHKLGSLPCMNHKPHEGDGRGIPAYGVSDECEREHRQIELDVLDARHGARPDDAQQSNATVRDQEADRPRDRLAGPAHRRPLPPAQGGRARGGRPRPHRPRPRSVLRGHQDGVAAAERERRARGCEQLHSGRCVQRRSQAERRGRHAARIQPARLGVDTHRRIARLHRARHPRWRTARLRTGT